MVELGFLAEMVARYLAQMLARRAIRRALRLLPRGRTLMLAGVGVMLVAWSLSQPQIGHYLWSNYQRFLPGLWGLHWLRSWGY